MKKLFPFLFVAIFGLVMTSCDRTQYIDNTQVTDYPAVYDLNVDFTYNSSTGVATYYKAFVTDMYDSDFVMIYRKVGTDKGNVVWQPLPQTIYNIVVGTETNHELDYTYDFTKRDISIYASGTFDLSLRQDFITGQTFRIVLVPAVFGGKSANRSDISKMSYEEVIRKYNIDDSKVGTL